MAYGNGNGNGPWWRQPLKWLAVVAGVAAIPTAIGSYGLWADQHRKDMADSVRAHDQALIEQGAKEATAKIEADKTRTAIAAIESFKAAAEGQLDTLKSTVSGIKTTIEEHGRNLDQLKQGQDRIERSLERFMLRDVGKKD